MSARARARARSRAAFEDAVVHGTGAQKRAATAARRAQRCARCARRAALKDAPAFPFHAPDDVLAACIEALEAVTGSEAGDVSVCSNPDTIFAWTVNVVAKYGDLCREEGAQLNRRALSPRIPAECSEQAYTLMTKLNALFTEAPSVADIVGSQT
jgi:hypothetical protein